jgi:hypothetical protein
MNFLICSAMRALMPTTENLPGIDQTGVAEFVKQMRAESTFWYFLGVAVGALVFTITPVITIGVPLLAFMLPKKALDRHTAKIAYSKCYLLRSALLLVKLNAGMCWGRDPKVCALFNLKPDPADPGTWRTQ